MPISVNLTVQDIFKKQINRILTNVRRITMNILWEILVRDILLCLNCFIFFFNSSEQINFFM